MQLLLSKILISHENVFELLGIYPDESFALTNDIYLKKSFQKVDNFVGTIDGQTFIFDNLKLDTSEATSEMFEEFSGVISNLALRFAQFDTGTPTNVYGISQNLKGTLSKISIQAEISVDGTTPQSYFLLGSTVSASISGLWASITLTAAGASQTLNVSFANVFTASVVDSTFTSSFNSDDLLNSHFTALCQANSAASSSNITVRTSFKNILAPTLNMSLVTNSFQSALNNYQLYVNVSFRDTLSSPLKNLFIISQSLPTGALLSQLKVTAYIDAETETLQTLSFLPNVQSLTMAQSFIKFTLSSSFANNSQFQIFQGPGNQITIRNTSFIVNVTKFVNGNFSTVSQQLDNSNIESCSFYIIFDMREVVIANIFVTGIVQQTTGTNLKYSNSYFSEKQNTQHSPTKLEPIIRNSNGGIVSFLASYFFIQQVPASIYLQMQNGFITNYESMNVNNCIIIFNMTMSTGTNSEYAILAQNATKTVFENITLQVIAVLEYSNQSWSVLGQGLSFNQYKNIVVYGKIQFDGHNFFMPITVLAYTLNECIIENMYLEYDLISTPLGQIQTYQFLIFNEIGENTITNFIYVGVYVNSDTLVAFQPDGVQSGLKESSTIQIIYSDQRNRFKYDTGAQISLGLDNLRNVDYMKNINLFNQSVWYYSPGINTNLPRFNFAFQTVNWKYEKFDGFNNENTELVSGTLTKNHFQPKNGPNLCQMECQGTWTFWDTPPTCLSGFTGPLCQIDCAASPCQNSGKCTDGKCECVGGFSGLACEIAHCDGCSETCELVLGDTFQCGRACVPMTTCIQGTCTENICVCNDDISSGIGDAVQCNKEDSCIFDGCGDLGVCMNEKCECRPVVSIEIDGTCRQVTFPELGECGVIDDTYECISCLGDRLVPLCVDCIDDYKEYDSVCYPVCADCNGDCVTISGTEIHCFTCLDSFAVPECKECIPDHKEADKVCYEITNVGKGDCWLKDGATVCASCLNNYAMPTCADCIPDYLENNDICYPICPSTECRGDGCLMPTSTTFKCASCLSGFKMPECRECITGYKAVGEQCYEIIQEDQGDCWDQEGVPTCASCINNYQLPDCQQCIPDYLLVSAGCLEICKDCHGAKCVITAAAEGICESCDPGFKMPACKECEAGHTLVGSACLEVVNEDKGICWDDAGTVTCSECFKNYEVPSCQTCKAGYVEKGSECLLPCPGDVCFGENCLIEADGSYSCDSCSPRFKSPGCSTCIEDCVFVVDQCLLQVNFERGECYLLDADSFCNFCFNGFLMPDCRNCEAGFEEVEFRCMEICTDCYGTGCYVESGSSSCESCHPGFAMPSCQQCGETFVLYEGACHPGVLNANGSCIEKDGATLCISCDPAFVLSQDATRCIPECTKANCVYGSCLVDEVCECDPHVAGTWCDSCIPEYGVANGACYKVQETPNGTCFYKEDASTFCTGCEAGFELSADKSFCFFQCTASNCMHGDCVDGKGCVCNNGYSQHDGCLDYHCDFDSINPCEGLGECVGSVCACFDGTQSLQNTCYRCNTVVNGRCEDNGVVCEYGWKGLNCDVFDCRDSAYSCDASLFDNTCIGPMCHCAYPHQMYDGDCLDYCELEYYAMYTVIARISIIQLPFESELVNLGSVLKKDPNGKQVKNSCILGCLGCLSVGGKLECNPGVQFASVPIAGATLSICSGCKPNYSGDHCEDCDSLSVAKNGFCYLKCLSCNGECYFNDQANIECSSCDVAYAGTDCSTCDDGYLMVDGECLLKCKTCHGDCYISAGGILCHSCTEGYSLESACQGCAAGYHSYKEQCLRECDTCDYGTCFYYQHTVVCSACHNGAELSQCKNCREGFVLHEGHCQPLIPGTECVRVAGAVVCLSCNEGEYLIAEQCYPACKLPFCRNGECYESPTPICSSCYPNFQMQPNGSCLEIRQHEGGVCTVEQKPLCDCYEGYGGPICEACSQNANFLDDRCFQDCKVSSMTCHGICQISFGYSQVVIICSECHIGYRLPGCQLCVDGFKLNVDNECKLCEDGWLDQSMLPVDVSVVLGEGCYKKCIICEQGDCWYQGPSIKCVSCSPGYSFTNNCQTCESGYTLIGGRCLVLQDTPDGICGEYSDQVCQSCQQDMALLQCQVCESGHVQYDDQCYVPLSFMSGNCISLYESEFICQDESICKEGYLFFDEQFCIECSSEYILMNFTCWIQLAKYEMLYSGDCLQNAITGQKLCLKCADSFTGVYCDQCKNNFIQCQNFLCCEISKEMQETGICHKEIGGSFICNTCATGFHMVDQLCIGKTPNHLHYLWLLLLLLLIIAAILAVSLGQQHKLKLFRYKFKININRIVREFFKIFCGVFFCQIIALCVALQDAYVDDIYLYSASLSLGSFPFAFLLFFLQAPNLDKFYYHSYTDFFMFLFGAGLDFLFQITVYLLLPEAMSVSQTIFKCFSAPFSMLLFTFILKMKYKFSQMLLLFVAVALPLYYALQTAFKDVFTNPYMLTEESVLTLILAIFETMFATLCQASQILFLQKILGSYSEIQVMMRLGFAFFLLYFFHTLLNFKEIIESVSTQQDSFMIAVTLVVIMNVLMPVTLMFISPLAVTFNMVTSAVWVEIIDALSIGVKQGQNFYPQSIYPMVFCIVMFIVVFVSLVLYYRIMNHSFEKFNQEINQKQEKKSFMMPFIKMKLLQRQEYNDMNGIRSINPNSLKTFIRKKNIKNTFLPTNMDDFICIDNETGQEIQFIQPKIQDPASISSVSLSDYVKPKLPKPKPNPTKLNNMVNLSGLSELSDSHLINADQ